MNPYRKLKVSENKVVFDFEKMHIQKVMDILLFSLKKRGNPKLEWRGAFNPLVTKRWNSTAVPPGRWIEVFFQIVWNSAHFMMIHIYIWIKFPFPPIWPNKRVMTGGGIPPVRIRWYSTGRWNTTGSDIEIRFNSVQWNINIYISGTGTCWPTWAWGPWGHGNW